MDARIPFVKHWWHVCFRRWQVTKSKKTRKALRSEMCETAKTVLEFRKEVRGGK